MHKKSLKPETITRNAKMTKSPSAVVFPGQGTQRHGMGADFFNNITKSRQTYEEASDTLGWDVATLCFGDDGKIHLTEYAQPCILSTEIAMFRGLQYLYNFSPSFFGGHSLGEYTALVAAGAMPFSEALTAVHIRGKLMQQAVPAGTGAMAAVIGDDLNPELIRRNLYGLPVDVANINSADQIVISGQADSMQAAEKRIQQNSDTNQSMRFVPLNVSAPFHSRFMNTIRDKFEEVLTAISAKLNPTNADRVTSNVTGGFHAADTAKIIEKLVIQISSSVNWRANMQALAEKTELIYEIGPNRPLRNFF